MMPARTPSDTRVPPVDASLWEEYRLYQRDLLLACFEDADLMLRRRVETTDEDRRLAVGLLWEKRCQPWKFWRDEMRAVKAMDLRQGRVVAAKAEA
jgi:hypothetical protein